MEVRKYLGKLDYRGVAVLVAVALVLGLIYSFFVNSLETAVLAMFIAVFGSYVIFASFLEEEKPLKLMPDERLIVRTLGRGYIMFPNKLGGFMTNKTSRDLDIYLTDRRIIARKSSGEHVFEQRLEDVEEYNPERRFMAKYLRVRYDDKGKHRDVLLFVGDVDLWMMRLKQLGVRERGSAEKTGSVDAVPHEVKTVKNRVLGEKKDGNTS